MSMNSHPSAALKNEMSAVGRSAIRRTAYRLLPFVFLHYVVNYIDRVNVSFANPRMSADLGFSDRVQGSGAGMFHVTYVLFEIPEAVIGRTVERKCTPTRATKDSGTPGCRCWWQERCSRWPY